jgi:hypothetical protein
LRVHDCADRQLGADALQATTAVASTDAKCEHRHEGVMTFFERRPRRLSVSLQPARSSRQDPPRSAARTMRKNIIITQKAMKRCRTRCSTARQPLHKMAEELDRLGAEQEEPLRDRAGQALPAVRLDGSWSPPYAR